MKRTLLVFSVVLLGIGCNQSFFEDPGLSPSDDDDAGPGTQAWGDEDVTCTENSNCALGETCLDGVCQMERCSAGPYSSEPPVGDGFRFFEDRDVVLSDSTPWNGSYWADGYPVSDAGLDYSLSWGTESPITDIAGGRMLGVGEEVVARAAEDSPTVLVGADASISLGFSPIALASGDIDGGRDERDELIALSETGLFAVCDVTTQSCTGWEIQAEAIDVTAGDVDGDGRDEVLLLVKVDGNHALVSLNGESEGDESGLSIISWADAELRRIDAGDLNGDGIDEIVGLEDGSGWFDWLLGETKDRVLVYSVAIESIVQVAGADTHHNSIDLAVGDLDGDDTHELALLRSDNSVDFLRGDNLLAGGEEWQELYTSEIEVSADPERIATVDFDGDSPIARLVAGPDVVPGRVVPTTVVFFPPYDAEHSDGVSDIVAGEIDSSSETYSDSVSLSVGIEVGVGASFMDIFGAKLSAKFRNGVSRSHELTIRERVGHRFMSS
ncbi:MAG: VCBS repeat-containing protein, partial [Myxococcota bacterium]|nr:VCBS repeat-containing protein [Myxococcota bacterium]